MACKRSVGQPLDSKRQMVDCHRAAVSPLPCTNTMGVRSACELGVGPAQALSRSKAAETRHSAVTPAIVDLALAQGAELLVTVDNGIASLAGIDYANSLGLPVLVTDHHLAGPELPAAAAIVNPNQPGCPFPSKHLAGVGVMFYVLLALRARLRADGAFGSGSGPNLAELLDHPLDRPDEAREVAELKAREEAARIAREAAERKFRLGHPAAGCQRVFQDGQRLGPGRAGPRRDRRRGLPPRAGPTAQRDRAIVDAVSASRAALPQLAGRYPMPHPSSFQVS